MYNNVKQGVGGRRGGENDEGMRLIGIDVCVKYSFISFSY